MVRFHTAVSVCGVFCRTVRTQFTSVTPCNTQHGFLVTTVVWYTVWTSAHAWYIFEHTVVCSQKYLHTVWAGISNPCWSRPMVLTHSASCYMTHNQGRYVTMFCSHQYLRKFECRTYWYCAAVQSLAWPKQTGVKQVKLSPKAQCRCSLNILQPVRRIHEALIEWCCVVCTHKLSVSFLQQVCTVQCCTLVAMLCHISCSHVSANAACCTITF